MWSAIYRAGLLIMWIWCGLHVVGRFAATIWTLAGIALWRHNICLCAAVALWSGAACVLFAVAGVGWTDGIDIGLWCIVMHWMVARCLWWIGLWCVLDGRWITNGLVVAWRRRCGILIRWCWWTGSVCRWVYVGLSDGTSIGWTRWRWVVDSRWTRRLSIWIWSGGVRVGRREGGRTGLFVDRRRRGCIV